MNSKTALENMIWIEGWTDSFILQKFNKFDI